MQMMECPTWMSWSRVCPEGGLAPETPQAGPRFSGGGAWTTAIGLDFFTRSPSETVMPPPAATAPRLSSELRGAWPGMAGLGTHGFAAGGPLPVYRRERCQSGVVLPKQEDGIKPDEAISELTVLMCQLLALFVARASAMTALASTDWKA